MVVHVITMMAVVMRMVMMIMVMRMVMMIMVMRMVMMIMAMRMVIAQYVNCAAANSGADAGMYDASSEIHKLSTWRSQQDSNLRGETA